MKEQIQAGLCSMLKEAPEPLVVEKLARFVEELLEKNKVMNLTAITEVEKVVGLHLLDSAALLRYLPAQANSLIDIGTGAGFPGVPLKILRPGLDVTLMDALQKRLDWLEETCQQLELEKIRTLHGRGEDLPHRVRYREAYDVATARAVADLRVLSEIALPFVKVGGHFLAMKSRDTGGEIQRAVPTIHAMGAVITLVTDYEIPGMNVEHRLVVMEKISETPEDYPRRWAKIKNTPILEEH